MIDFKSQVLDDDVLLVQLSGKLDSAAADDFFSRIDEKMQEGYQRMIIDLQDLEFVSSLGLGMIVRTHSRMKKQGGNVKLARIEGAVADIFRVVGFDQILRIYPTVEEAQVSFGEDAAAA